MRAVALTVRVEAGEYFLGDPCHAVDIKTWDDFCDKLSYNEAGSITAIGEWQVLAFRTAIGDGYYSGSDGVTYAVNTGLIGLVPVELIQRRNLDLAKLGRMVNFETPQACSRDTEGVMHFGTIVIDTTPS